LVFGPNRLVVDVSGVGGGNGGTADITASMAGADLNIGTGSGQIEIHATGGASGTATGDAGTINLNAGRELSVEMAGIVAGLLGENGSGAKFNWTAGTNLSVDSAIDVSAVGNGNGGVANLSAGQDLLVNGSLLAVGSGQGDGGSVALV